LFATIAEIAGYTLPQYWDSYSFKSLLNSTGVAPRPCNYSEINNGLPSNSGWTARDTIFKLIHLDNGVEYFYNLKIDPFEQNNLLPGTLNSIQQNAYNYLQTCKLLNSSDDLLSPKNKLNIFPNPTLGDLHIDWNGLDDSAYRVYNFQGKCLQKGILVNGINNIGLSNIPSGIYMLQTLHGTKKIVKQ